jgi:hypothetical protein
MIRLAWRQLRLSAVCTAVLLAALVIFLVITKHSMTSYARTSGLSACLTSHGDCGLAFQAFTDRYSSLLLVVSALSFTPMLAGLFWGAPLIAREIEQGTHRLAWTQSISRRHWLTVKLGILILGAAMVAAAVTGLLTWWSYPFERLSTLADSFSRISPTFFDTHGGVLIAATLYAFTLGTVAGAVIRRTVPAMAVTIGGYLGLQLVLRLLRGSFLTPLSITYPLTDPNPRAGLGDWRLSQFPTDKAGHHVSLATVHTICPKQSGAPCVVAHGFQLHEVYQPLSRFWALQAIESGILLTAAVVLLAAAVWWSLRRTS